MTNQIINAILGLVLFIGSIYGINFVTHGFLMEYITNPNLEIPAEVKSRNSLIFITIFAVFGISGLFQLIRNVEKLINN